METVRLQQTDFATWRREARRLLISKVPPSEVVWSDGEVLFGSSQSTELEGMQGDLRVPKEFLSLAKLVAFHRDAEKWSVLYRTLWRLTHDEPHLLDITVDDDTRRLIDMSKSVRRDVHKMHAFVRFRKLLGEHGDEHFVAWHRPDHPIVRHVAGFFRERFGVQRWTILTPDESVTLDGERLTFSPGVPQRMAPQADEIEAMWKTYYASIFNPARVKVRAMKKEMPDRHWATLPEAELIDDLLRQAPQRVEEMVKRARANQSRASVSSSALFSGQATRGEKGPSGDGVACETPWTARPFIPAKRELPMLAEAAKVCKGCDLYCNATQTVFGEGPLDAQIVMVGEQPGDSEDLEGRPFVGPAGQLLDEIMQRVGLPRNLVYVTNAVKHFKFEPRGKRRIHAKPTAREISACRPWLEAELQIIKPKMLVCLGATAAQSLLGRDFRVTKSRGQVMTTEWAPWTIATIHPSALLRIPDRALKENTMAEFESDLKLVAKHLAKLRAA